MKKKIFIILLCGITVLIITGCNKNQEEINNLPKQDEKQKILLELPHHIDIQEENEKTLNRKSEVVNIKNLNLESIEKGKLKDYVSKLQPIIDFIKNKYPNFDINKWNIMCNMYSEHGLLSYNHRIQELFVLLSNCNLHMNGICQ